MKKIIASMVFIFTLAHAGAINTDFLLDGYFNDWANCSTTLNDSRGESDGLDFVSMAVRNDEEWLYIRIELAEPIVLNENNNIYLEIDTDNDSSTGYRVSGIGAEMGWNFGARYGFYNLTQKARTLNHKNIDLYALPTHSSRQFEIAIGRKVLPDGINPLFNADTIRIVFWDRRTGGDLMPDRGQTYTYIFNNDTKDTFIPVELPNEHPGSTRIMTWNTFVNGMNDPERQPVFERIFSALQPEIITLNECWKVNPLHMAALLNTWLPLETKAGWFTVKTDEGNITCSRYPIAESFNIMKGHRISAALINLPASPTGKLLVINAHFTCCQADDIRQKEADAIVAFLRETFKNKGKMKVPEGTPFYIAGDLNMVGDHQQLITLLTGDIVDNKSFGSDFKPDGNQADLTDLVTPIADRAMAYTWRDPEKTFSPSRLDFILFPANRINILKGFTLQTEIMSVDRLTRFRLFTNDTRIASDHLPRVADVTFHRQPSQKK